MSELRAYLLDQGRSRPRVSIVVAWQGCPSELSRRLRSWIHQLDQGAEILVVCSCSPAERQRVERAHPGVRVMPARAGEELASLRQLGVSTASGDIVVIFDDSVATAESWRDHLPATLAGSIPPGGVAWSGRQHDLQVSDASAR